MDAKQTALENAMRKIEKDFGKGAIMRLGDIADKMNMEVISSGSLAVDLAVGVGGYPRGRVIEIYGPESSGKTTLALHAIASAQKSGGFLVEVAGAFARLTAGRRCAGPRRRRPRFRCGPAGRCPGRWW